MPESRRRPAPMLDIALNYAARGWPVFPLGPRGSGLAAKRPLGRLVPHGLKQASLDPETISGWWDEEPTANVGIRTGVAFDVLDLDDQKAIEAFVRLAGEHDLDLTHHPGVATGRGGQHLLFAPTGFGNRAGVMPGVDWRGRGGYVVAAGSIHPNGTRYEWIVDPNGSGVPPAPEWLLALIRRPEPQQVPEGRGVGGGPAPDPRYVNAAIDAEMRQLRGTPVGQRNDQLNRSAYALGQMVAAGWISDGRATAELQAAAHAIEHGREPGMTATIRSGLEAGKREPRAGPAPVLGGARTGAAVPVWVEPEPEPEPEPDEEELPIGEPPPEVAPAPQLPPGWARIDLGPYLRGEIVEPNPTILDRADGEFLLYPGKVHWISGEPEGGKTWLALIAVADALADGHTAVYVDFEGDPTTIVERLLALGTPAEAISERLSYHRPEVAISEPAGKHVLECCERLRPAISVIDGVQAAMGLGGLNSNDARDFYKWWEFGQAMRKATPGALLAIDHVVKNPDARAQYAAGTGQKQAAIDVHFGVEVVEQFGIGRTGRLRLMLHKDRSGRLRQHQGSDKSIGCLVLVSESAHKVRFLLEPPSGCAIKPFRPTALMERVSRHLELASSPRSARQIRDQVTGNEKALMAAVARLHEEGYLTPSPRAGYDVFSSSKPFRQDEDPLAEEASNEGGAKWCPRGAGHHPERVDVVPLREPPPQGGLQEAPLHPPPGHHPFRAEVVPSLMSTDPDDPAWLEEDDDAD